MAYYAAVISLKNTLNRLLNNSPQISLLSPCRQVLESARTETFSLQEILEELQNSISDSSIRESSIRRSEGAIYALNCEIREAACKLEDLLESHVADQFLISESDHEVNLGGDFVEEVLMPEFNSLKETVKKMKDECLHIRNDLKRSRPQVDDDDVVHSESEVKSPEKMVGLSDQFHAIKSNIVRNSKNKYLQPFLLVGMGGIGKTTLARKFFEDKSVQSRFNCCAFVTVGQKYKVKEILLAILSQVNPGVCEAMSMTETQLHVTLRESLFGKRCLIVLDDVWSKELWDQLQYCIASDRTRSQVLVTTRQENVANGITWKGGNRDVHHMRMRFLNKEESLYLLREKVFGEDQPFPDTQLAKAAEKIIDICEGLPLAIIAIANLLSKAEKTPRYWNEVGKKGISIFNEVGDNMYKVLISSYNYLPQYLKPCFLYMGVFPSKSDIPVSKLIKMWIAEAFLDIGLADDKEHFARKCSGDLASKSDLILVRQQSFYNSRNDNSRIKTCSVHSVYWHLCNREAVKERFSNIINSYADGSTGGMESQSRRLCVHNNVLFGIREVHNSMESISMARSLLCTGPHHLHPLPTICFGSRLLRVLDALTIRFYDFPIEVVELVQLRYLALTYSGNIPSSISKLWNLEYLIVRRHLSIISSRSRSSLPIEIWNMKTLRCLQVMGSDLILPNHGDDSGALLSNLLTLSCMSANSCTKEILAKTPNLKKLGIQIELAPDHDHPLHCFDHIAHLHQLESLTCVVVNPNPTSQVIALPASTTIFPCNLTKLSLSGLGYPWEDMELIGGLPNLCVLKLRCFAFRGPHWQVFEDEFPKLQSLLIEDTDLEYLEGMLQSFMVADTDPKHLEDIFCDLEYISFPELDNLTITHCYNLQHISIDILYRPFLTLKLIDCPLALASPAEQTMISNRVREFCVESSWKDKKSKK